MSLASDDLEHVIVAPGRHFTPTASAGSAMAVSGDEVEGDLAQEGEVAGGGAVAHPAVILTEGDVEHPMQGVLDAPVPADGLEQQGYRIWNFRALGRGRRLGFRHLWSSLGRREAFVRRKLGRRGSNAIALLLLISQSVSL